MMHGFEFYTPTRVIFGAGSLEKLPEAVLFADEPTGNLDAENAESVAAILSRASMRYGQTIVMVTHDRQMADYADRILSMENIVACMK